MPYYQLTIQSDSPSEGRKADIAAAITRVHAEVTGAPEAYVNVSFTEVPPGSLFVGGEQVEQGRMVGIIRAGRSDGTKRELLNGLAEAWSGVTGEPMDGFALFIVETPGANMMEEGAVLREAYED